MASGLRDHGSENEESSVFFFETDHLALRGNQDYGNLLRTIAVLEAQRARLIEDLNDLDITHKQYLADPRLLLKKIHRKEDLMPPNYCTGIKIPDLDYFEALLHDVLNKEVREKLEANVAAKVRGRVVDVSKPEMYNQLWSYEEQVRLEQLLVEYPAEEVEMRRYVKIAKALGNRTPQQVTSRVQKYFQKLHDAGMPIPGRKPKNRRSGYMKPKHFYRPSTFFPAFSVPVHMPEDDMQLGDLISSSSPSRRPSIEGAPLTQSIESAPLSQDIKCKEKELDQEAAEERKLEMLRDIRNEKLHTLEGYNPDPLAIQCEQCKFAAISRTRWHCNSCCESISYCGDCLANQLLRNEFKHILHDLEIDEEM